MDPVTDDISKDNVDMASQTPLFKITDGIAGADWAFEPGDVLMPDGPLPENLRHVAMALPADTGVPVNVIRLKIKDFEYRARPRVEVELPKSEWINEKTARQRTGLLSEDSWFSANQLNFPRVSLVRMPRKATDHHDTPAEFAHRYLASDVAAWIGHVKRAAGIQ